MLARICLICSSVVPENMASADVSFRTVPLPNQLKNRIIAVIDGSSETNIAEVDKDIEILTTAQIVVLLHPLVAQDVGQATPDKRKAPRKTDITAYIEEHYTEQFTLSSLAERYNLNPSYFARSFKRDNGQTVFEYLHGLRISAACTLLKRSNKPVLEIAIEVGYNNISFFNRCFRRITGTTPVEYRRS
jgi:YesN/AraC family two-component response regulator